MKKKDLIVIIVILGMSVALYLWLKLFSGEPEKELGTVTHKNEIVLAFDINKDYMYELDGSYGKLYLEVKDRKWRITNEECPNHICSSMGWIGVDDILPIICLPNEIFVEFPHGK